MVPMQCNRDHQRRHTSARHTEPHSTEFISALAAGMNAKLILEVCGRPSQTTIALAAAARQTGGRLICLLSQPDSFQDTMAAMKELGLAGYVEFIVGDADDMIPRFPDVDFALIDCKQEDYVQYFNLLRLNPARAVVVADKLFDRKATAAYGRIVKRRPGARSITLPIGEGIEVTRLTRVDGGSSTAAAAEDKSAGGGGGVTAAVDVPSARAAAAAAAPVAAAAAAQVQEAAAAGGTKNDNSKPALVARRSRVSWACDEGIILTRSGRKSRFRIE